MNVRGSRLRAWASGTALVSAVGLALVGPVAPAQALKQVVKPSFQTNGRVNTILTLGNTVYIGGDFTAVRPAGVAPGLGEIPRNHLAAFRLDTGKLRAWRPSTNGPVSALAASPDGRTVFVGGGFSRLNTKTRHNLGAVSVKKGATTKFSAPTNGPVLAIVVTRSTVYFGGEFTRAKHKIRGRLAATTRHGQLLRRWHTRANGTVRSLAMSADRHRVYVGGDFTAINRHHLEHFTALTAATGEVTRWKAHPGYGVWDIIVKKRSVYLGGNGAGGRIQAFTPKGRRLWSVQTDGGVQTIAYFRGNIVVGGHFGHICVGNSPGPTPGFDCPTVLADRSRLLALGHKSGGLKGWNPTTNGVLGVFALATTRGGFFAGGEFTKVSGIEQQGFARFARP